MQKICKGASLPGNFQTGADACLRGTKDLFGGKQKRRDASDMTAKLLLVLFLLLPISVSCTEKSCEDLFYGFLHKENEDTYIVLKIRDFIRLYKSSDVICAWNEDEIVNHRFELVSKKDTEQFVFKKDSGGNNYVLCIYGKKGAYASAPVEYWLIDGSGFYTCMKIYFQKTKHDKTHKDKNRYR